MEDIKPSAIKIGMINAPEVVFAIVSCLKKFPEVPVVFDPVMVATSGDKLIQDDTIDILKNELFPLSTLITPNIDEAEILSGMKISSKEDMISAGKKIVKKLTQQDFTNIVSFSRKGNIESIKPLLQ